MIRLYNDRDKNALVELIRLNTPKYFALSEEQDFIDYLEQNIETYFVAVEEDRIVGCAGINYFTSEGIVRLSWDIVHPDFHGKGIGTVLVRTRIEEIKKHPQIHTIVVRTSQKTYRFYV